LDDPTVELDLRVAIRPADLERAGADPSRLLLLRFDRASQTWEDTHATVDADALVAHANKLSAFAVGLVEHPSPNTSSVGFLDRFVLKMPQLGQSVDLVSSPTETPLAPTAIAVGTAEPVPVE